MNRTMNHLPVLNEMAARQFLYMKLPDEPMGRATELTCTCGGILHERMAPPIPRLKPGPRQSRNRRIRKKQIKKWARAHARLIMAMNIIRQTSRPMGYRCASCKRHVGFYEAIGRNVIKIEPMPGGALPIYDRDPDVSAIVAPDQGEPV